MKRAKKPKTKDPKYTLSEKQMQKVKNKVTDEIIKKTLLLFLSAAVDEVGLTDDQVCAIWKTANRYGEYIDQHLVKIQLVQETIEKGTGIKFKGMW